VLHQGLDDEGGYGDGASRTGRLWLHQGKLSVDALQGLAHVKEAIVQVNILPKVVVRLLRKYEWTGHQPPFNQP